MDPIFHAFLAQAAAPQQSPGGAFGMFLPLILIFVVFYFLMIRPQAKQQKLHQAMVSRTERGHEIVTSSGFIARVLAVEDTALVVDIGGGTKARLLKGHVAKNLTLEEEAKVAAKTKAEAKK